MNYYLHDPSRFWILSLIISPVPLFAAVPLFVLSRDCVLICVWVLIWLWVTIPLPIDPEYIFPFPPFAPANARVENIKTATVVTTNNFFVILDLLDLYPVQDIYLYLLKG